MEDLHLGRLCSQCHQDVDVDLATPAHAGVDMGADSTQPTAVCRNCGWTGWLRETADAA